MINRCWGFLLQLHTTINYNIYIIYIFNANGVKMGVLHNQLMEDLSYCYSTILILFLLCNICEYHFFPKICLSKSNNQNENRMKFWWISLQDKKIQQRRMNWSYWWFIELWSSSLLECKVDRALQISHSLIKQ